MLRRAIAAPLILLTLPGAVLLAQMAQGLLPERPASEEAARSGPGPTQPLPDADEAVLRRAGVGLEPAALIALVRNYARTDLDLAAFRTLTEQLGSEDHAVRERATQALIALGRPTLPHLRPLLDHTDLEVRRRARFCIDDVTASQDGSVALAAARHLARRGVSGAAGPLLAYLPDADADTELAILAGLPAVGRIDGKPDPALIAALTDVHPAGRAAAALTLARLGAAEHARNALSDKDALVRLRAAQGLLAARDDKAVGALIVLLGDAPLELAWQAEELLTWAAAGPAPAQQPLGAGTAEERRRCQDGWSAWWRARGRLDWARIDADHRRPGLYLVSEGDRVFLCGCDGKPRWALDNLGQVLDAHLLPNGRLLLADGDKNEAREIDLAGKMHWQRRFTGGEIVSACQRLSNGHTFIVTDECLVETTPFGQDVLVYRPRDGESIYDAVKLSSHRIVAVQDRGIVELDAATGAILQRVQQGRGWFIECKLAVLPDGQYLLADNNQGRLVRVDRAGKAGWSVPARGVTSVQLLRDGHFLTTASENEGRVAEHAPDGRVVWEAFPEGAPLRARPCLEAVRIGLDRPRPDGLNLDSLAYRTATLKAADVVLRRRGASFLAGQGEKAAPAVPALIDALADEDAEVRARAGTALALVGEAAVAPLIKALKDRPDAVRIEAARSLAQLGGRAKEAVPDLTAFVADGKADTTLRRECATALGALGPAAAPAVPALLAGLADGPMPLRDASARALGHIGATTAEVVPALTRALRDRELPVRCGAATALGQIGAPARGAVPELIILVQTTTLPDSTPVAVGALRSAAAVALGQIGPDAAAAALPLAEVMKDVNAGLPLRRAAITALGRLKAGARPALPAFAEMLKAPDLPSDLSRALANGLQAMGADGVPTLALAVKEGNRFTRRYAITSLTSLGKDAAAALPALEAAAKDMDRSIAAAAERAILHINGQGPRR
jgi:HEAT repeat protein